MENQEKPNHVVSNMSLTDGGQTREATQEGKYTKGEQIAQIVNVHVGSDTVIKNRNQGCSLLHSLAEANSSTKSAEIYDSEQPHLSGAEGTETLPGHHGHLAQQLHMLAACRSQSKTGDSGNCQDYYQRRESREFCEYFQRVRKEGCASS